MFASVWLDSLMHRVKSHAGLRRKPRFLSAESCSIQCLESRMLLAATAVGGEFRVNKTTASSQDSAAIAMDGDGDFVVTWESDGQDGDSFGIYAQRYAANGAKRGDEFRVNTTTTSLQTSPKIAMDAGGDFVIVWSSWLQDGSGDGVYAQRYSAAGTAVGKEFRVNTTISDSQSSPSVAMDVDGDFVIAWASDGQDGSFGGIYAQRYDSNGVVLGSEFRVNLTTVNDQRSPEAAMAAGGAFVVVWTSALQDGSDDGIYAQLYNSAGEAVGVEFRVNQATADDQFLPSVAMASSGDFIVTWTSASQDGGGYGVYARRFTSAGQPKANEARVNQTTVGDQGLSDVGIDASGAFVITWTSDNQDGSGYGVYALRYSNSGAKIGGEIRVNVETADAQGESHITMEPDGDFVIAWQSQNQDGSGYGVYARRYNEPTDYAGPVAAAVFDGDRQITPGDILSTYVRQLTVTFSEDMNVGDLGVTANSVINHANWQLTSNGADISNNIRDISFGFNAITNRFEAVLTFYNVLTEGSFLLTAKSSIKDKAGNFLDGTANRSGGSDFTHAFAILGLLITNEAGANSTVAGAQRDVAVATDADGDYVVVWQSALQDTDGYGIYARRYTSEGDPLTSEFRVHTDGAGDQTNPSVAMDANGNFVVIWENGFKGIYGQRFYASGVAFGVEFKVNTTHGTREDEPSVAMDARGDFLVTWTSEQAVSRVFMQRYDSAGTARGGEVSVSSGSTKPQFASSVSMDADGDFVVAWSEGNIISDTDVLARCFDSAGVPQQEPLRVNSYAAGNQGHPDVAMSADGDFVVTWTSQHQDGSFYGIYARRYHMGGGVAGGEFRVNSQTVNNQYYPTIAMDNDGDFTIAWASWNQDGSFWGVYGQSFGADAVKQRGEFLINSTTADRQLNPAIAMDTNGDFVIAWESLNQDTSGTGVYLKRWVLSELVSVSQQTLSIYGTIRDDVIQAGLVFPAGGPFHMEVVVNGVRYQKDPFKYNRMEAISCDGNDQVLFLPNVPFPASIFTGAGDDVLSGGFGDDVFDGGSGNDTYLFNSPVWMGSDTIVEFDGGVDTLDFSQSVSAIRIDLGNASAQIVSDSLALSLTHHNTIENIVGGPLSDTISGNLLNNHITGGGGSDLLIGGPGNDVYHFDNASAAEVDRIVEWAGGGTDTLDFTNATNNVSANLLSDTALVTMAKRKVVTGAAGQAAYFENVTGGSGDDSLAGNVAVNILRGGNGNDTLNGGSSDDVIVGESGNDTLVGEAGNDTFVFDTDLALGSDTINEAGGGIDTLNFAATATRAVNVNLGNVAAQVVNAGLTLTLSANNTIENVIGGSLGDTLTGNGLANVLAGGAGDDMLNGGAGNDILIGGIGADALTGGSGENLLLGTGYTGENNVFALIALRSEWTSASSYLNRVAHLLGTAAGGANGNYKLTSATVKEDNMKDTLKGGAGKDWYLRNSLGMTVANRDLVDDADLDSVFTEISSWL